MVLGFWSRDKKKPNPRAKRFLAILCVAVLAAVVGFALWRITPSSETYYTDADTIKQPAADAQIRDILWQPPAPLSELINTTDDDYEPRLSADGLTLFFVRGKAGENADIFTSRKTYAGWSKPQPIAAINSKADDLGPEPSTDGKALYFYSNREGTFGGYDLWVARVEGDTWAKPVNLGPNVNSPFNDYRPALTADGATLYFSSNRPQPADEESPDPGAWSATLREDLFNRTYDLYAATMNDRGIGRATPIVELNTPYNEGAPAISPFGDFLYFSSDRPGGEGGFDLYRSRSLHGAYREAMNLGSPINTTANELDPALAMGGYALYFSSDRPDQTDQTDQTETAPAAADEHAGSARGRAVGGLPEYDLFYSTSREVFSDTQRSERDRIDWAALWGVIGPNLLWALLALLLLLAMLSLYRAVQNRRMSLLAKCLLASLAAHLLLLMLMNAWEVASAIAGEFNRRGTIRVAIASPSSGDAIASQIRGELTRIDLPDVASAAPLPRVETTTQLTVQSEITTLAVAGSQLAESESRSEVVKAADAVRRPRSELVIPERPVEIARVPLTLAATVPNEPSRMDTVEQPVQRQVSAEQFASSVRATVDTSARQDPARIDLRPAQTAIDFSQGVQTSAQVSVMELTRDQRKHAPTETAFVDSGLPEKAARLVNVELVKAATPQAHRVDENNTEALFAEVKARPGTSLRASPSRGLEKMTGTFSARVDSSVAPSEMPVEHFPESVTLADAETADRPPAVATAETLPAPAIPPPLLAVAALVLPAVDRPEREAVEVAAPSVDPRTVAMERLHLDVFAPTAASTPTPTETPDALFTDTVVPTRVWRDTPVPRGEDSRPQEIVELPRQPLAVDSLRLPIAVAVAHDLKLETLAEEIEPQLESDDPWRDEIIGMLRGQITDKETGEPLAGAEVRLTLPIVGAIVAVADRRGRYAMNVPDVPDFFAVSATRKGYVPETKSVSRYRVEGRRLRVNFELTPHNRGILVTEAIPDVHHLGDNRFEGRINSQFQKESQGDRYRTTFLLRGDQMPPTGSNGEVLLLAKGVQRSHRIVINGETLDDRLDDAPSDGSFGEFVAWFDVSILRDGQNVLEIIAKPSNSDIDDFEFVNVRVRLIQ